MKPFVRRALLLVLAVLVLLPVAGYDFANRVQYHAGSAPGSWSPGPASFAAFLRLYPHAFTPASFRQAFGLPGDLTGRGQTIAIVEIENGFSQAALDVFDRDFHLPSTPVRVVDASGRPLPPAKATDETMLDVEWAHAIAPAARIAVIVWQVTGLRTGGARLAAALAAVRPDVVSASAIDAGPWALAAARAGVSLGWAPLAGYPAFVSSGDGGDGLGLPALLPAVAAVGGVSWGPAGPVPWLSSGGGFADWVVPRPSWQDGNPDPWRGVPDVAFVAGSPGLATYVRGWVDLEGTSAAAPEWAALWSLGDQLRVREGRAPLVGPAPPALYALARAHPAAFRQPAGLGGGPWNPVTGLGVPVASRFLPAFAGLPACCRASAAMPLGSLPVVVVLLLLGGALYTGAVGWPRRGDGRWPLWWLGLCAVGFAAYGLADGRWVYLAGSLGAFVLALVLAGLPA